MDRQILLTRLGKAVCVVGGVYFFILGLKLIVLGAAEGGVDPLWRFIGGRGVPCALGFGWIMACVVLSGSPVAAVALALHAAGTLNDLETFGMLTGSRLGASFVVLLIGFLYDVRGKKHQKSTYVGALALATTLTTFLPAMAIGLGILKLGWVQRIRVNWAGNLLKPFDMILDPVVKPLADLLPPWGQVLVGVLTLLLAFKVFDLTLPEVDPTHGRVARMATVVYRPMVTFLLGMFVTCLTLSVSVSVSILVPLTAKGYVRRENLIPYVMGANIATWIDTIFAALALMAGAPDGFAIVAVVMVSGAIVSLPILVFAYAWYERIIDSLATLATRDRKRLAASVLFFLAVPVLLLVL